ncbi:hypothetical protein CTE07_22730 [Chitinophaga terrae (ex Kim and Jung 2007)]|nr:hypothetical protein CTE07_22730 [Chitinophaga terrae (ex Kim and Jung 2007)]
MTTGNSLMIILTVWLNLKIKNKEDYYAKKQKKDQPTHQYNDTGIMIVTIDEKTISL